MFKLRETEKRTESINLRVTPDELAEINWCSERLASELGRVSAQDVARMALGEFAQRLRSEADSKTAAKRKK